MIPRISDQGQVGSDEVFVFESNWAVVSVDVPPAALFVFDLAVSLLCVFILSVSVPSSLCLCTVLTWLSGRYFRNWIGRVLSDQRCIAQQGGSQKPQRDTVCRGS